MSTRRARIKGIASLPVRRKNTENLDSKVKSSTPKENFETVIKSPKTPRISSRNRGHDIPGDKIPNRIENSNASTDVTNKLLSPTPVFVQPEVQKTIKTPQLGSTTSKTVSIFVSPARKDSPSRRPVISPLASTRNETKRTDSISHSISTPRSRNSPLLVQLENGVTNKELAITKPKSNTDVPVSFNPPSVPESVTDDGVMDGIIPLKPSSGLPKPIHILKNEIISERAEVSFDPIVPLPSPSKVRPKLRPMPRLNPLRRNSIQGSASESEDENRRALLAGTSTPPLRVRHDSHASLSTLHSAANKDINRIRNDSVCSAASNVITQPANVASPTKEKHVSKSRRTESNRRMTAMRWRHEPVQKETLTMYDLIYYNPTTNPIVPDQDEIKAKEANEKDETERIKTADIEDKGKEVEEPSPDDAAPVPQIKLGPNGEIILDEKSLVIKQTESSRKLEAGVVHEGAWGVGRGGKYTRGPRTADWSEAETVRFYRALAAVGTDFTLMVPLFPDRSRKDLKLKFKKEEKVNGAQVDKALRSAITWDAVGLQTEFSAEREAEKQRARDECEQLRQQQRNERKRMKHAKQLKLKHSKGAKAIESVAWSGANNQQSTAVQSANEIIRFETNKKSERKRKAKPKTLTSEPEPAKSKQKPSPLKEKSPSKSTLSRVDRRTPTPKMPMLPTNVESGSLVVLAVNDPKSPTKKILQTYISHGLGKLTPIALPSNLLSSVVNYVKDAPNAMVSPEFASPASVASQDSRDSQSSGSNALNLVKVKRKRHSSYTITPL